MLRGVATNSRSQFASRWGLNIAILVVGTLVGLQIHGRETRIESYRLDAEGRLVVMTSSGGPLRWNRLANVEERDDAVRVTVRTAVPPVPMADIGIPAELIVPLDAPLGDRAVIDGSTGEPVPEAP
jgi:hypothetical protein